MKKLWLLLILSGIISWGASASIQVPQLKGRVNDYSKTLSNSDLSKLDAKLAEQEKSTKNQIVILLIASLEGETIEEFAVKVFESWKLGKKGEDNGVLLLFAMKDHKSRIEVGYGLEPILTDAVCGRILREDIQSKFKDENYYEGLNKAVSRIISFLEDPEKAQAQVEKEEKESKALTYLLILAAIGAFLGLFGGFGKARGAWTSGIIDAFLAPIIWWNIFGPSEALPMVLCVVFGLFGGVACYWILYMCIMGAGSGSSSGDYSSGGSSYSGGGGSSGGGGASGGW
ncbi:MAG: TPM domain-containing protein [Candidatus Peribacteria bacterium]|jgi:uncharacterized protein|nr:TPM domain-containing protein [Candidatus Peribacteria bacterium]